MSLLNRASENRLLASLSQEDLKKYFSTLHPMHLEQKDVLYEVGAPIEHVYFMEGGLASILTTMEDGSSVEVGMIGLEGMVGISALLGGKISSQHVVVQLAGNALRMSASECKAAFEGSAAVRKVLLRFIEVFFNLSAQTAACNRLHSVEQRCARWLLMSSDRCQSNKLTLTHEFMSAMLGVRRTGVTEIAGELQRSGLLRYQHGQVVILDREGLAATACECYRLDRERFERLL